MRDLGGDLSGWLVAHPGEYIAIIPGRDMMLIATLRMQYKCL